MKKRTIYALVFITGFLLMFAVQYEWIRYHKTQFLALRLFAAPILTGMLLCFLAFLTPSLYRWIRRFESSSFMDGLISASPLSRREPLYAFLLLALIILLCFNNVFIHGHTFRASALAQSVMPLGSYNYSALTIARPLLDTGASAWAYEPWAVKVRDSFAAGQVPLWNPNSGFGVPLLANMQSAPFSPFRLVIHLFSFQYGWEIYIALRMLAAGLFTFLFLRLFRCSRIASFTSAIIFMFCGYNILNLNMGHLDVDILAPAGIFAFECLFRNPRPIRIAFSSIIVCFILLGGMPESAFCVLVLISVYYAFRVIFFRSSDIPFHSWYLKKAGVFFISVLLGFLLSGPQLFPFLEYLQNSWTTHNANTGIASNPLMGGITLAMPHFFGDILFVTWNGINSYHVLPYVGAIPLLLAFCAVFSKKNQDDRKYIYFFAFLALFIILKYFGFFLVNWVGHLPFFKLLIFTKYPQPVFAFCIAILAGMGIEALIQRRMTPRSLVYPLALLVGLASLYFLIKPMELFPQLREPRVWNHVFANVKIFLVLVLIAFILAQHALNKIVKTSMILLACLILAELYSYIPPERALRYDPATVPPYVKYLRSDPERHRVFGTDAVLYPNSSSYFDIDCITNLDALYLRGYFPFLQSFLSPESGERFVSESMPRLDKIAPYLNLVNVKYILAKADPAGKTDLAEKRDMAPEENAIPPDFSVVYNKEIKILRNKNYFPRTFIVPTALCANNEKESLDLLRRESSNLREKVILEDAAELCRNATHPQDFQSETQILNYSSNEVIIQTHSSHDGFLVLTDSYYPGWEAYIDEQKQPILRADRLFRALSLKAGSHKVRFIYAPDSFRLGLISFIVSFITLGLWVIIKRQ